MPRSRHAGPPARLHRAPRRKPTDCGGPDPGSTTAALRSPSGELADPTAWLYRVARNVIIDHYRGRHPTKLLDSDPFEPRTPQSTHSPTTPTPPARSRHCLRSLIEQLPSLPIRRHRRRPQRRHPRVRETRSGLSVPASNPACSEADANYVNCSPTAAQSRPPPRRRDRYQPCQSAQAAHSSTRSTPRSDAQCAHPRRHRPPASRCGGAGSSVAPFAPARDIRYIALDVMRVGDRDTTGLTSMTAAASSNSCSSTHGTGVTPMTHDFFEA